MTPAALEKAAMALPGAEFSIKCGADRVYSVGGKMFAATDMDGGHFSLKVSDIAFEVLTETGRANPAPYAARFKWVMFEDLSALDDAEVKDLLKAAHALVAEKLPKKQRAALGLPV
jgi:predicted DNA-binding protein (MmcQ/YjbR family)